MLDSQTVTVLTTEERCDAFRAAIGSAADFRFDPYDAMPLHLFLANLSLSAARAVVLDEDYFLSPEGLVRGLADFLDEPAVCQRSALHIVCVCSRRKAGDALLHRLASYFAIYDIVYDCPLHELGERTARLLANPNRRIDVLELLAPPDVAGEGKDSGGVVDSAVVGGVGMVGGKGPVSAATTTIECKGLRVEIVMNVTSVSGDVTKAM